MSDAGTLPYSVTEAHDLAFSRNHPEEPRPSCEINSSLGPFRYSTTPETPLSMLVGKCVCVRGYFVFLGVRVHSGRGGE